MADNMVLGVFRNVNDADIAMSRLRDKGFSNDDISVVTSEEVRRGSVNLNDDPMTEDVKGGAKTGGLVGAVLGFLTGIGAITIPGIGALLIAGPIAAALGLTGVAATTVTGALTGALAGGLIGALKDLGIDELTAKNIEDTVKNGGVLLGVDVMDSEQEEEVKGVMEASNVDKTTVVQLKDDR